MRFIWLMALSVVFLSGCAFPTASRFMGESAGKIGCPSEEIEVTDLKADGGVLTWSATCRGKSYICSESPTGKHSSDISCAPELGNSASGPETAPKTRTFLAESKAPKGSLESFQMKGKVAGGIEMSPVNFGVGPTVEYWLTDQIVGYLHAGFGTFNSYGARADYLFKVPQQLFQVAPYLGIGYSHVKGPDATLFDAKAKTEGSGVDVHLGALIPVKQISPNVALRAEMTYSSVSLDTTVTVPAGDGLPAISQRIPSEFFPIGFGLGIYYFFN